MRALATLVALVAIVSCGEPEPVDTPPRPLRILVVNDDGWNAPGVVVLRDALRRAGHTVVQVSPAVDRSDAGTAATMSGPLSARRPTPDPDVWSTSGTAADAARLGIFGLMGAPDLVISGIDATYTASIAASGTGTVGAAFVGATNNVPAVAIGTASADPEQPPRPADLARVADFAVRLVERLQDKTPDAPLVPTRTVLNVNYPRGPEPAREVVAAATSDVPARMVTAEPTAQPGTVLIVPREVPETDFDDDISELARSNVTLTDLSADPDRSTPPVRLAAPLAERMRP